jgi:hypothetical protein
MSTYASRFENLSLPVILARKGKGHRNVIGQFSVGTSGYIAPEELMLHLLPVANGVLTPSMLAEITEKMAQTLSVSAVEVGAEFELPLERMSEVNFRDSISMYTAGYQCTYSRRRMKNYIWVTLPVVVNEILPLKSETTVVLGYKEHPPYFEDVLFGIEKLVVPMNPAYTPEEKLALRLKLLESKTVYVIISDLLDFFTANKYLTTVDIEVKYTGCTLKTDIRHTVEWKRQ